MPNIHSAQKMNSIMSKLPLVLACLLLVGTRGAAAAANPIGVCGSAQLTYTSPTVYDTCTCPTGTGVLAGTGTFTITGGTVTAANVGSVTTLSAASSGPMTGANTVAVCTDIMPGYAFSAATAYTAVSALLTCPANSFCPGKAAVFGSTAGTGGASSLLTSATAFGSYTPGALATYSSSAYSAIAAVAADDTPVPCPTNTGTAGATGKTQLSDCAVTNGYYVSTAYSSSAGGTSPVISQCPAGSVCLNTNTAATAAQTPTTCAGNSGGVSSFICPLGTYSANLNSHSGSTLVAADVANEVVCQANSVAKSDATTCIAKAGYYGANDATGTTVTYTACPTGVTTTLGTNSGTGQTALTGCTDLKAGYGFNAGVTSSTSLAALIAPCSTTQYGCGGSAALFVSGPTTTNLGITAAGSMVLASATTLTAAVTTAAVTTGSANVIIGSCPSGVTVAGGNTWTSAGSLIADCTDLAVGWAFNPSITSSTNITALLTQCTAGSYGCAGKTGVFGTQTAAAWGTTGLTFGGTGCGISSATVVGCAITTAAANAGANIKGTCPAFATNTFTATSSPTWAATAAAAVSDCTDLVPGYAMSPGVTNSNQDPTVLLDPCTAGTYAPICAGSRGLFTANPVIAVANISYYPGLLSYASSDLVLLLPAVTGNVFGAFGTDSLANAPNSPLLLNTCPTGSTNAGGAAMTSISSCIVKPGYYIDPSALNTPEICPANEYCLGGGAVGTVGGDTVCPTGSVGLATASALSSSINDCVLSAGFYTTSAAINTPVPCLSGFICAGGAALGTAGGVGSVACPTGSTNAACLAPTAPANTTTTVNGAPVTVSPAAVTVSPAAVTVTPAAQPITVNVTVPAPIFSAAPRAAAHAAVLALTAVAALVAF